ncbi:hypothetical protein PZT57_25960 [Pseudomonas aeruginosa]|uniref:hypothetical protein n=1 Tax=Pseudomonas aeruginosa TaxID=287 RepID=UPI002B268203|nr:hypothetical protein [Pseudomonas aeruginosa]MEA8592092.1 hypothetical protein [Pseudomonas aeruginosa]
MTDFQMTYDIPSPPIRMEPINGEMHLKCPECQATRLQATTSTCTVPVGRYWLTDGDTIPGLQEALFRSHREKPITAEQKAAGRCSNYDYELLVGNCHACLAEYFVLSAKMIDSAVSVDEDFVEAYFYENCEVDPPTYWCGRQEGEEQPWLIDRHETPKGIVLCHTFGPFSLNGSTMKGEYGVSSCSGDSNSWGFAWRFMLAKWSRLKELAAEVNREPRLSSADQEQHHA